MSSSRPAWLWWMFAGTILLSAFLLFLVQPLIAKILLPWFGGSTGVWATCVVFFQVMLVFGYAYAHVLTSYLTPKQQMLTHLSVLGLAVLAAGVSIMPGETWRPENSDLPILKLGLLLLRYVGLPYFALATTGPLVQAWFARLFPGKTPYRLYALSNFGSLASLLLFPTVFEQFFGLRLMSTGWSLLFAVFAVLAAGVAYVTWREAPHGLPAVPPAATEEGAEQSRKGQNRKQIKLKPNELPTSEAAAEPSWGSYLLWLALPAFASYMLVAGTNHLCQDVASVPFLWVMPLSLYLISFIICFDHERWYQRLVFAAIALAGLYMSAGMYKLEFNAGLAQGWLVRGTWPVTRPLYEKLDWYKRLPSNDDIPHYQRWLADLKKNNNKLDDTSPQAKAALREQYQAFVKEQERERFEAWKKQEATVDPRVLVNLPEDKSYIEQKYLAWLRQAANVKWLLSEQHMPELKVNFIGQILAHCVGLFGLFMICHGELTRRKPPAKYLTSFYMMIAIGGAIGGALVSLAAPFVFDTYAEWFLGLILALLVVGGLLLDQPGGEWYKSRFFLLALPAAALCLFVLWQNSNLPEYYLQWSDPEAHQLYLKDHGKSFLPEGQIRIPDGDLLPLSVTLPLSIVLLAIIGVGCYAIWDRAWQRDKLRFWVINLAMLFLVCFVVWDVLHYLSLVKDPVKQKQAGSEYKDLPVVPFDSDESYAQQMSRAVLGANLAMNAVILDEYANRIRETLGQEADVEVGEHFPSYEKKIFQGRNFYGALAVHEHINLTYPKNSYRYLMHGRILHGNQFLEGEQRYLPTSYYTQDSGIGLAVGHFRRDKKMEFGDIKQAGGTMATVGAGIAINASLAMADKMHVCAIGLGTGTITAYGKEPGQAFTIYEINPLVEQLSATKDGFFKYIPDAREQGCLVEIVLGDARLQMQREAEAGKLRKFDVLVVDAFSGDSIPTHLLTREAMDTYLKHMRSDQSIIAIHITNRYLNLRPVCRGLAEYAKLNGCVIRNDRDDAYCSPSTWVLLTNNREFLEQTAPSVGGANSSIFEKDIASILWTDDFTTLLNILYGTGSSTEEKEQNADGAEDD